MIVLRLYGALLSQYDPAFLPKFLSLNEINALGKARGILRK
jgi:hypothetical protein